MKTYALTTMALALAALSSLGMAPAHAQSSSAILAETYGEGVHAYNSGRLSDALNFFSLAIDNGSQDPRVFYYRGIVNQVSGRPEDAEKDWQAGAVIEALAGSNPSIGRSLARYQGTGRIQLEKIRQAARIKALAEANARSKQRYGEIGATPENAGAFKRHLASDPKRWFPHQNHQWQPTPLPLAHSGRVLQRKWTMMLWPVP